MSWPKLVKLAVDVAGVSDSAYTIAKAFWDEELRRQSDVELARNFLVAGSEADSLWKTEEEKKAYDRKIFDTSMEIPVDAIRLKRLNAHYAQSSLATAKGKGIDSGQIIQDIKWFVKGAHALGIDPQDMVYFDWSWNNALAEGRSTLTSREHVDLVSWLSSGRQSKALQLAKINLFDLYDSDDKVDGKVFLALGATVNDQWQNAKNTYTALRDYYNELLNPDVINLLNIAGVNLDDLPQRIHGDFSSQKEANLKIIDGFARILSQKDLKAKYEKIASQNVRDFVGIMVSGRDRIKTDLNNVSDSSLWINTESSNYADYMAKEGELELKHSTELAKRIARGLLEIKKERDHSLKEDIDKTKKKAIQLYELDPMEIQRQKLKYAEDPFNLLNDQRQADEFNMSVTRYRIAVREAQDRGIPIDEYLGLYEEAKAMGVSIEKLMVIEAASYGMRPNQYRIATKEAGSKNIPFDDYLGLYEEAKARGISVDQLRRLEKIYEFEARQAEHMSISLSEYDRIKNQAGIFNMDPVKYFILEKTARLYGMGVRQYLLSVQEAQTKGIRVDDYMGLKEEAKTLGGSVEQVIGLEKSYNTMKRQKKLDDELALSMNLSPEEYHRLRPLAKEHGMFVRDYRFLEQLGRQHGMNPVQYLNAIDLSLERDMKFDEAAQIVKQNHPAPRVAGGPITANRPYLVGEEGPELIFPEKPGWVANNNLTKQIFTSPLAGFLDSGVSGLFHALDLPFFNLVNPFQGPPAGRRNGLRLPLGDLELPGGSISAGIFGALLKQITAAPKEKSSQSSRGGIGAIHFSPHITVTGGTDGRQVEKSVYRATEQGFDYFRKQLESLWKEEQRVDYGC